MDAASAVNDKDTEIARLRALIAGQSAPKPAKQGRGRPKGSVKKATPEVEIVPKVTKKLTKKEKKTAVAKKEKNEDIPDVPYVPYIFLTQI